jgi:hypothetical protein
MDQLGQVRDRYGIISHMSRNDFGSQGQHFFIGHRFGHLNKPRIPWGMEAIYSFVVCLATPFTQI